MSISLRRDFYFLSLLFALCIVLFGFNLGGFGLLDPDEPFYTLTAKEMLESGDWSTPQIFGSPQFEKPIFFYWVLCASFKLFGVNPTAARLGPCLAGILTVLVTYLWARVLFRKPIIAFASAAILATAAEFIVVSRIVLTDIYLCLFVTAALYAFSLGYAKPKYRLLAWNFVFVFSALGFLTKGILGFFLPFTSILLYLWFQKELLLLKQFPWLTGSLLFALVSFPWYALMTAKYGFDDFLKHFILHENIRRFFVAEHRGFDRVYFYPGGVLLGFFPWSFALPFALFYGFRKALAKASWQRKEFLWLCVCLSFFVIFFSFAKSKLLSYIFPIFPILALLMGAWGYRLCRLWAWKKNPGIIFMSVATVVLGILPSVLAMGVDAYAKKMMLDLGTPILLFSLLVLPMGWIAVYYLWKRKGKAAFIAIGLVSLLFSWIAFGSLLPNADAIFASRDFVEIYRKDSQGERPGMLIGSKLYVRGVSFYTSNKNMAVLTENPSGTFYTNHSIPMLSTTQDLEKLDAKNFPVYCFLRKKEYDVLKKIVTPHFKITELDNHPQRALLRLDRA